MWVVVLLIILLPLSLSCPSYSSCCYCSPCCFCAGDYASAASASSSASRSCHCSVLILWWLPLPLTLPLTSVLAVSFVWWLLLNLHAQPHNANTCPAMQLMHTLKPRSPHTTAQRMGGATWHPRNTHVVKGTQWRLELPL